jgi:hypothetical protein
VSHSAVLEALKRFNILQNGNGHKQVGPLPFGFDYINQKLVENKREQDVIRMIRQHQVGILSLRQIAGEFNQRLNPTKNNGAYQADTVKGIPASA